MKWPHRDSGSKPCTFPQARPGDRETQALWNICKHTVLFSHFLLRCLNVEWITNFYQLNPSTRNDNETKHPIYNFHDIAQNYIYLKQNLREPCHHIFILQRMHARAHTHTQLVPETASRPFPGRQRRLQGLPAEGQNGQALTL